MKKINTTWRILSILAIAVAFGYSSNIFLNSLIKKNQEAEWYYDAADLSIALNKQVEKIEDDPDDIKQSDLYGLNNICHNLENTEDTLAYSKYIYGYDGIRINCGIVKDAYDTKGAL